jgi:hypothetical protein
MMKEIYVLLRNEFNGKIMTSKYEFSFFIEISRKNDDFVQIGN